MGTTNTSSKETISKTDITLVENGHQKLMELQSHIKQLINTRANKNDLTEIFFSLSYFYENYLIKEEIFLKKTGYPNLGKHSASHKDFINAIIALKDSINKDAKIMLKELEKFIVTWLKEHETNYNSELVGYLRNKGFLSY